MPWLSVGAAYETKSWFQDFAFQIPDHQAMDRSTGQMVAIPAGTDKLKFNQPSSATLGVAVTPIEPLTIASDLQLIRWSETNGASYPNYVVSNGAMPWNLNWQDQWVIKVGGLYRVTDALSLKAGYNYGRSPLDPNRAFENIAFPAIAEHHITGGVGLNLTSKLLVNAAVMVAPEVKVSGSNAREQYIASYTTKMSQVAVDVGVGYKF